MSDLTNEISWSQLYAVVLNHQRFSSDRVRWNNEHQAWVGVRDFDRSLNYPWKSHPGTTAGFEDRPSDDDLIAARKALEDWLEKHQGYAGCERCGSLELKLHFIAPDVYGDPKVYCVQRPSYSVVESRGGSGRLKHWGSPYGCQSVEAHLDRGSWSDAKRWTRAAYLYGNPLSAEQVINRDWCTLCTRTAGNVRSNSAERNENSHVWEYESAILDIGRLARLLLDLDVGNRRTD